MKCLSLVCLVLISYICQISSHQIKCSNHEYNMAIVHLKTCSIQGKLRAKRVIVKHWKKCGETQRSQIFKTFWALEHFEVKETSIASIPFYSQPLKFWPRSTGGWFFEVVKLSQNWNSSNQIALKLKSIIVEKSCIVAIPPKNFSKKLECIHYYNFFLRRCRNEFTGARTW